MAENYPLGLQYHSLRARHKKFVERAAVVGVAAGLVILALNGKAQAQAKKILELKAENIRLNKDLELAWGNVKEDYLVIWKILEVVKPSDEQLREIDKAVIARIKTQGR